MRWVAAWVLVGCGPAVVLDEEGPDGGTSTSSPPSGSTGGEEEGPPDMPDRTTSGRGSDESSGSSTGEATPEIDACPQLASESVRCLFLSTQGVTMIGLDSGATCIVLSPATAFGSSLLWRGDEAFVCDVAEESHGLTRLGLVDGTTTESDVPCEAVTEAEGDLALMQYAGGTMTLYASFDAALAGDVTGTIDLDIHASRITTTGDRLYGAWHSTASIEVWDLPSASLVEVLPLEGHDDWVQGIAVADDRLFLLAGIAGDTLVEFDATTGARIGELPLGGRAEGLACRARG